MNLHLTDEQMLLTENFRRLFEAQSSMARVRAVERQGFDPHLWRALASLGALSMLLPNDRGGDGLGLFYAALVMEEAGRQLASTPIAETMIAVRLLAALGDPEPMLANIRAGEAALTLALRDAAINPTQIVPGGAVATGILFLTGDQVRMTEPGPARQHPENLGSLPLATVVLSGDGAASSTLIAARVGARQAYLAGIEEWKLLTAAGLLGLSGKAIEMAADYANTREQFGRPIGSFQAVAHPLADLITDISGARMLNWRAFCMISDGDATAAASVSMAWWWTARTSGAAVARALHCFGGYGVTNEFDIQIYHRRAKATALLLADPRDELVEAGRRLWIDPRGPVPDVGALTIDMTMGEAARMLADENRTFFTRQLTPEQRANAHYSLDGHDWALCRATAAAGLLFPSWPIEHGGRSCHGGSTGRLARLRRDHPCPRGIGHGGADHPRIRFGRRQARCVAPHSVGGDHHLPGL